MPISVRILAHSIAPCGKELYTVLARIPRVILAEVRTHRDISQDFRSLSMNSASSRAIPTATLIQRVEEDPFTPEHIGRNQKGMSATEQLPEGERDKAVNEWMIARDNAVVTARHMLDLGVHKQVVNRVIEPWMWTDVILSGTEWANWDTLRVHKDAEPHFFDFASKLKVAREESVPRPLEPGEWHLPLISFDDDVLLDKELAVVHPEDLEMMKVKVAMGRCARVSYLTHAGIRNPHEDIQLHDRLAVQRPLHASPAEHVAQAMDFPDWFKQTYPEWFPGPTGLARPGLLNELRAISRRFHHEHPDAPPTREIASIDVCLTGLSSGPFWGWKQYRKFLPNETVWG